MDLFVRIIIFLEVLLAIIITTDRCSKRKYSITRVVVELSMFTIVLLSGLYLVRVNLDLPVIRGAMALLIGCIYYFPLKHLYYESSKKTLSIMFFSGIHTVTVTYLSLQISNLFGFENHLLAALIIQTIMYLITIPIIIKFINNKFLFILQNITIEVDRFLITISLLEFVTLSIIHLNFRGPSNSLWKVITIILVALTTSISYELIYVIVKNYKSIDYLKHMIYTDKLTGARNRMALMLDSEELISKHTPFSIIYMDLNNFKRVNDEYGHSVGDEYLKKFTDATLATIGEYGSLYRMSGDEFIGLYKSDNIDIFLETFDEKFESFLEMDIPFLGVSIGCARFPQDAESIDDLIIKADNLMYTVKKKTKLIQKDTEVLSY